jgi:hypothetical protein
MDQDGIVPMLGGLVACQIKIHAHKGRRNQFAWPMANSMQAQSQFFTPETLNE